MAGYVFGIGFLAFAAWQWWSHRTPPGAIEFTGTIVEERSRKSTQTGRRRRMHAPVVTYQHPVSGRPETYEPTRFGGSRFVVGSQTALVFDPAKDRVFRPLDRPVKDMAVLSLVGIGFIVAEMFG